jgi:hypothetical protein
MTIHDLMDLENKLLVVDRDTKDNLSFSARIILQELLKRIGWITNSAIVLADKNKLKEGFSETVKETDMNYVLGDFLNTEGYKEIEKLFGTIFYLS